MVLVSKMRMHLMLAAALVTMVAAQKPAMFLIPGLAGSVLTGRSRNVDGTTYGAEEEAWLDPGVAFVDWVMGKHRFPNDIQLYPPTDADATGTQAAFYTAGAESGLFAVGNMLPDGLGGTGLPGSFASVADQFETMAMELTSTHGYTKGVDLFGFPYVWSKGVTELADELKDYLVNKGVVPANDLSSLPVKGEGSGFSVIAHGYGGQIVRMMLTRHPGIAAYANSLILLGCPTHGYFDPLRGVLRGQWLDTYNLANHAQKNFARSAAAAFDLMPSDNADWPTPPRITSVAGDHDGAAAILAKIASADVQVWTEINSPPIPTAGGDDSVDVRYNISLGAQTAAAARHAQMFAYTAPPCLGGIYMLHGNGTNTLHGLDFDDETSPVTWAGDNYIPIYISGDGVVPAASASAFNAAGQGTAQSFGDVTHHELTTDSTVRAAIVAILASENPASRPACRTVEPESDADLSPLAGLGDLSNPLTIVMIVLGALLLGLIIFAAVKSNNRTAEEIEAARMTQAGGQSRHRSGKSKSRSSKGSRSGGAGDGAVVAVAHRRSSGHRSSGKQSGGHRSSGKRSGGRASTGAMTQVSGMTKRGNSARMTQASQLSKSSKGSLGHNSAGSRGSRVAGSRGSRGRSVGSHGSRGRSVGSRGSRPSIASGRSSTGSRSGGHRRKHKSRS